jgi:hypothetical protein
LKNFYEFNIENIRKISMEISNASKKNWIKKNEEFSCLLKSL